MQLQFPKTQINYLNTTAWEIKNSEYSQEIKLPDAMPDVGRVLGAWGQPLMRSKDWRSSMSVSGGIMAWVLYVPEDGSAPRSVETWIPIQEKWELVDSQRDGIMIADCRLQSMDARSASARKLIVRAAVSFAGEALEPAQLEISMPDDIPEGVQLLKKCYPVQICAEAGEKAFTLEEALPLPDGCSNAQKLLYYQAQPEITEQKVMGDKLIFRGKVLLHMLCRGEDGSLAKCDLTVPFSQYTELERTYGPHAQSSVALAVTGLELEKQEESVIEAKVGLVGQYRLCDRIMLEVVEDAYSTVADTSVSMQQVELPVMLEEKQENFRYEAEHPDKCENILDLTASAAHPTVRWEDDALMLSVVGSTQMLCLNEEGALQGEAIPWNTTTRLPAEENARIKASVMMLLQPHADTAGEGTQLNGEGVMHHRCCAKMPITFADAIQVGETIQRDPMRPSLVLRRSSGDLWNMAKTYGTTVHAILEANSLEEAPQDDRVLLIPVP